MRTPSPPLSALGRRRRGRRRETVHSLTFTLERKKRDKHAELLAALREAEAVARDPNAPTCTELGKLKEFMLS